MSTPTPAVPPLDELVAMLAAADLTWSGEVGDPPGERPYIEFLAARLRPMLAQHAAGMTP